MTDKTRNITPELRDIPLTYLDCEKRIETDLLPICHYYQWGMVSCEERRQTKNCLRGFL